MAVDTAEKRRSAFGTRKGRRLGVTPNAAQDIQWRVQAGWGYSGLDAYALGDGSFPVWLRRRRRL